MPRAEVRGGGRGRSLPAPERFDAKEVLRRTGWRVRDEGGAAAGDLSAIGSGLEKLGAGDLTGTAGTVILTLLGGLLGLILLSLLLGNGTTSVATKGLGWLGSAVKRLVDPSDPLTEPGQGDPAPTATSPSGRAPTGASAAGSNPVTARTASSFPYPQPSGKIETVPGTNGVGLDSSYVAIAQWIENTFGVTITSGYRTVAHNAAVGGVSDSAHLKGLAADFAGTAAQMEQLVRWAEQQGFPYVETPAESVAAGEGAHVHITFFQSN